LESNNSKAYLRKGIALFSLEEFEAALAAFKEGQKLDSENSTFKTWIRKCNVELETEGATTTQGSKTLEAVPQQVTPPVVQQAPVQQQPSESPKVRHEWYQTASHVFVSFFVKNAKKEDASVDIQAKSLNVSIKLSNNTEYQMDIELCDLVTPSESSTTFGSTKIELKLKKANAARWKTLEDTGEGPKQWDSIQAANPTPAPKPKKNWDKIIEEETKGEKLEGDESLNKVFQDIYSGASDEQKQAMMKSYLESGGTVLSTNWDEVGKGEVKGSPPDGLEMKKWSDLAK